MHFISLFGFVTSVFASINDNFLLFTDSREGELYKMNLSTYISEPLFGFHPNPIAVSFDKVKEHIYWSDNGLHQIKCGDLKGKTNRVVRYLGNDSVVDGISVDSVSRLLFFTDSGYSTISVVTLDGNNYQKTIIQEAVDKPRAIVSDYETGVIYWTDWGESPRIEKANYDGSEREDIITKGLYWPNGLAIDFKEGIMYWCDGKAGLIEKSNLDGTDRRVLSDQFGKAHFFGLALDRKRLYYTDWSRSYVMELLIRSGMHYQLGMDTFSRLNGIYFHKGGSDIEESTGCTYKRGGCSHICIPRPRGNVKCLCPDGMSLQNDEKECDVDLPGASEPLRLLVIGRVGVGKSTVGNVLIGRKVFAVPLVFSNQPGTLKSTAVQATNFLGQHIRIIDTPGVYGSNQEEKTIKHEIAKGLRLAKPGPHALLFVTRIGKFTAEDEKAIEFYERNFGSQVTKYIVVVFTGKEKLVGEGINIHDYVKSLNPRLKLKALIEKTEHRYVAFSDTGFILDQKKNVDNLLDIIGRMMLKNLGSPYFGDPEDSFVKHEKDKYKP